MNVDNPDLDAAAREYAGELRRIAGDPPVLDIVHLGLGSDGHTASLTANDPALEASEDVVVTGPVAGHRRLTLTLPAINRARHVVWLVIGAGKADAIRRLYAGDRSTPAGRVNQANATLIVDRRAASGLTSP
jgi:6-phosphogluconolactonase